MRLLQKITIPLLVTSAILLTGCRPEQMKAIAQSSGTAAAVTWIAFDGPSDEEIKIVSELANIIKKNASEVGAGRTYLETLYPLIIEWANEELDDRFRPISLAGATSLLQGVDLLFAMNPSWRDKQETATDVVVAFINGAQSGFGYIDYPEGSEEHEIIAQSRAVRAQRLALGF